MRGLRELASPAVEEVRGRGLLIGVQLNVQARRVAELLLDRGVVAKDTHDRVLRIAPPLVIEDAEIGLLLQAMDGALKGAP